MPQGLDPTALVRNAALSAVPIEIRVCVGRAHPRLGEIAAMTPETVLPLDARIEDHVGLYVGDRLIAEAELVELDAERAGQLAVRIVSVVGRGEDAA